MAAHDQPTNPGANNSQGSDADLHLERLLAAGEEPFYRTFWKDLKEFLHPPKLPPLEVTSKPVPVKEIWGFYGGQEKRAGLSSMAIHVTVLGLLFLIGTNKAVQKAVKEQIDLIAPDLSPYKPTVKKNEMHGGGGGGDRSATPPSKGKLPRLSKRLGVLTRTNSESIVGAGRLTISPDLDLTHGVAITSSIHPTSDTHIEPCRYGKGSNAMGLLQTLMTDGPGPGGTDVPRWKQLLQSSREDPRGMLRLLNPRQWSERTMIALVMQHLDNSITTFTKRGKLGIRWYSSKQGHGEPNPTWNPVGNEVTRRIAAKINGVAGGTWGELFNMPLTAHFLGGAVIGDSPEHGVIDPYHRVYGYPTLLVVDVAAISANLGVNPSLSISAQAERAASLWPNKGENDVRPRQGEPYRRLDPIAPAHPVVPAEAPGALRWLPIEPISSAG